MDNDVGFLPRWKCLQRKIQQDLHDPFSDQAVPEPKQKRRMMGMIAGLVGDVVRVALPGGKSPCVELTEVIMTSASNVSRSALAGSTDDEVKERLVAVHLNRETRTQPHLLLRAFAFAAVLEWVLRLNLRGSWKESPSYRKTKVEMDVLATCEFPVEIRLLHAVYLIRISYQYSSHGPLHARNMHILSICDPKTK